MRLSLENFQAHSNTDIDIEGMTVITGKSNAGKSSIIRALLWVITNKPTGTAFIKHGKKDVSVWFNNVLFRERSPKLNRYGIIIEGETENYDAIKTDVPKPVEQYLNLVSANIQRQRDVDFLIGLTPTAAGALLDSTLHLTDISMIEAEAARKCREAVENVNKGKKDLEEAEGLLASMDWLPEANKTNEKIKTLRENLKAWDYTLARAGELVKTYCALNEKVVDLSWTKAVNELLEDHAKQRQNLEALYQRLSKAEELNKLAHTEVKNLKWIKPVFDMNDKRKEITLMWSEIDDKITAAVDLQKKIAAYDKAIANGKAQLKEWRKLIPKNCPTCGQPWEGAK